MKFQERVVWHSSFLPPLNIPERFMSATPAGITHEGVHAAVERYVANFWEEADRGIAPVFVGRAGQYKTYGACVIARYVQYQRIPTTFVQCGPFFTALDAAFYSKNGMQPYTEAVNVAFLVLDDFTQVKSGTRPAELLGNLLGERFAAGLPTVVTGNIRGRDRNHGLGLIGEQYRPDFARRLLHGAGSYYVMV